MKKPRMGLKMWIALILFSVGFPYAFIVSEIDTARYLKEGRLVEGTVVSIKKSFRSTDVYVVYQDEEGKEVKAEILNVGKCHIGDKFTGYVLADKPKEVFRPPGKKLYIICIVLVVVVTLTGWLGLLSHLRALHEYYLLQKKGIPVYAELVEYEYVENVMECYFSFNSYIRKTRTKKLVIPRQHVEKGQKYRLLYYEKPGGKCVVGLDDTRLSSL